jgi:hypothetical protein
MRRIQEKLFVYSVHIPILFVVIHACVCVGEEVLLGGGGGRERETVKWFKKDCEVLGDYSVYRCHLN